MMEIKKKKKAAVVNRLTEIAGNLHHVPHLLLSTKERLIGDAIQERYMTEEKIVNVKDDQ